MGLLLTCNINTCQPSSTTVRRRVSTEGASHCSVFFLVATVVIIDCGCERLLTRCLHFLFSIGTLWVPATIVNIAFVTPVLRVLYDNLVFFFWTIYLSMVLNK